MHSGEIPCVIERANGVLSNILPRIGGIDVAVAIVVRHSSIMVSTNNEAKERKRDEMESTRF